VALGPSAHVCLSVETASTYINLATEPHTLAIDGDVDGDGYDDLVIGAPETSDLVSNQGAVFVFTGPLAGTTDTFLATARLDGWDGSDRAGCAVSYTGDLDGDGGDDILVGAWAANYTVATAGAAYLVTSPFSGTSSLGSARASFLGEDGGYVGYAVTGTGDLTGDGLGDFVVGALLDPGDITGSGAAFLLASDGL
jgi:hypothetical protein